MMNQPRNDIEDVLSSIRRLVAEEGKPAPKPAPNTPARAPLPALMLDPTRRVMEPENPFRAVPVALHAPPVELVPALRVPEAGGLGEAEYEEGEDEATTDAAAAADAEVLAPQPEPHAPPAPADVPREPGADAESRDLLSDLSERIGSDEALRELIAETVRQELAGALGERITRNVRKLVRRELRQMLAGDEFD